MRIEKNVSNLAQLQIAVRAFVPTRRTGPAIWLVGVSHIGESNYYTALQRKLDKQTLVLFEGISGAASDGANAGGQESRTTVNSSKARQVPEKGDGSSLQSSLAASLGLVFQLEVIDYDRPNFRNCDLSIRQLRELIARRNAAPAAPDASQTFEDLLQMMEGSSWLDSLLQLGLRFLGANPKLQALGRLALIDTLGRIQGDPSQLSGLPPNLKRLLEVLLQERNENVVRALKSELRRLQPHGSIAVFYGTGHMPDLETRLRTELHYRPAGQVWFTAFSVDLARAGVSDAERRFVENLVRTQLDQLLPQRTGER